MIRIVAATPPLSAREQYGLDVLVDLSRLLVAAEGPPSDTTPGGANADATVLRVAAPGTPSATPPAGPAAADRLADGITTADGVVTVSRALLGAIADVAGAGVEQRARSRDRHSRVPSAENPLVAAGRERVPVVSERAVALRQAVGRAAGRRPVWCVAPWPAGRRWCAVFTHDVDVVAGWPAFAALRISELVRKGERRLALDATAAALHAAGRDPVWAGVADLLDTEQRAGITSSWFFLCGTPTPSTVRQGDLVYRPEAAATRRIMASVAQAGHEIALHGSFATGSVPGIFPTQRSRLGTVSGATVVGVRQHFLRMQPGATQRWMADAGFAYDATYGFPDRNGFRLGVADIVPAWDDAGQRAIGIEEVPLVWMDRAQSKYQHIEEPMRWIDDAIALAAASRAVEGLWVGLWHPNLTPALGFPGAPAAYGRLADTLMATDPFVASVDRVVEWRALRRAVRVRQARDGRPELIAPARRAFDLEVENAQGDTLASLAGTTPSDPGSDHARPPRVAG